MRSTLLASLAALAMLPLTNTAVIASSPIDFARDVAPILEQHCIRCHQPAIKKGDLSLATAADLTADEYLSPGKPDESHLLEVVTPSGGAKPQMPKDGSPLSSDEVALLRAWISEG